VVHGFIDRRFLLFMKLLWLKTFKNLFIHIAMLICVNIFSFMIFYFPDLALLKVALQRVKQPTSTINEKIND
jgi:hypothetical protein